MSIVINTPNGTIGRKVSLALLDAGEPLTVISRSAEKAAPLADRGAVLHVGSIDDPGVLKAAFAGAKTLFWLTPPAGRPDYHAWSISAAERAAALAAEAGIGHVVVLSSIGAQTGPGTGPVGCLLAIEEIFRGRFDDVTVLRPGYFMENLFRDLPTIQSMGTIFSPVPADVRAPMVATDDIATSATRELRGGGGRGHRILGLHGPVDLSNGEVVELLAEAWGRPIKYVQITLDDTRRGMINAGLPVFAADLYTEMYTAMLDGRMGAAEPRTAETTTPTSFAAFARTTLVPALAEAAS